VTVSSRQAARQPSSAIVDLDVDFERVFGPATRRLNASRRRIRANAARFARQDAVETACRSSSPATIRAPCTRTAGSWGPPECRPRGRMGTAPAWHNPGPMRSRRHAVPHSRPGVGGAAVKEDAGEAAAILTEGSQRGRSTALFSRLEQGMPQKPGTIGERRLAADLGRPHRDWERSPSARSRGIRAGRRPTSGTRSPTRRPSTSSMPPRSNAKRQGLGGDGHELPGNQRPLVATIRTIADDDWRLVPPEGRHTADLSAEHIASNTGPMPSTLRACVGPPPDLEAFVQPGYGGTQTSFHEPPESSVCLTAYFAVKRHSLYGRSRSVPRPATPGRAERRGRVGG